MKVLWAPWRGEYLKSKKSGCIFCDEPEENNDGKNYIFKRDKLVYGILNKFPYSSGHLMVAPYSHIVDLKELSQAEWLAMLDLVKISMGALDGIMHPAGYNIGMNLGGAVSGAGFGHLHLHVVPRWDGDTNFMPVLADTKVISEHLNETYRKLKERLDSPAA